MSNLLNENMLPRIKRIIPQVYDVLQTEDKALDILIDYIAYLKERTVLLQADVMNIPNLQKRIKTITDLDTEIAEDAEHLTLRIRYLYDATEASFEFEQRVLDNIPAHLKVITEYLKRLSGNTSVYIGPAGSVKVKYKALPMETDQTKKVSGQTPVSVNGYGYIFVRTHRKGK